MKLEIDIKKSVEKGLQECELTIGMTLKEAVEKPIPRKPLDTDWLYCPNCGKTLDVLEQKNYCANCGQKIDWRMKHE